MKFTEEDIKDIGLVIIGIIVLAAIFFYSTTFVHKTENTTVKKPGTSCSEQLAVGSSVCTDKNSSLFVGCNGFF